MLKKMALALTVLAATTATASAAPVYDQFVGLGNYTGSRDQSSFIAGDNYSGDSFSVGWEITDIGGGLLRYEYTFTGFARPDISHFILDLSDDLGPDIVTNISANYSYSTEFGTFGEAPSNPGFPPGFEIIGVKFDISGESPIVVSFDSTRLPVWGDLYIKGGSDSFAYNKGLTNHASTDVLDFIARPDGVVPEPSSVALMATGVAALGLVGVRRRRAAR